MAPFETLMFEADIGTCKGEEANLKYDFIIRGAGDSNKGKEP
jgi:hypothetical protein